MIETRYLSYSKLDIFKHSERCFFWRYCMKLRPNGGGEKVSPALWGSIVHAGIERLLSGLSVAETMASLEQSGMLAPITSFDPKSWHTDGRLSEVLTKWQEKSLPFFEDYEVLDTEVPLDYPIMESNGILIRWRAMIDVVMRRKSDGRIYFMDHKTTEKKVESSYYSDQFLASAQVTAYDYLGNEMYPGNYGGLFINAIQSSKLIPFTQATTSYERDDWQRAEFLETVAQLGVHAVTLEKMAEQELKTKSPEEVAKYFPMRDTYSENYCDFSPINRTAPDMRHSVISTLYHVHESLDED